MKRVFVESPAIGHRRVVAIALGLLLCQAVLRVGAQTGSAAAPQQIRSGPEQPAGQTDSEKEQRREMELLGIKELRPGTEKDANWDEAKANVYPKLPDALVEKNGRRVKTAEEWWKERRPEIVEDYDRELLGRTPAHLPAVSWEVVSTTTETMG
ncbi:MAG: hypothetical protein ABSG51_16470, partial [Terracidiphilus sp.]